MTIPRELIVSDDFTGLKAYCVHDEFAESPLEMDSAVLFAVLHRRYINPAEDAGLTSVEAIAEFEQANAAPDSEWAVFPLFMLDHSGTAYRASRTGANPFGDPWDSGRVGVIAIKRAEVGPDVDPFVMLEGFCEGYTAWANGDVWGYVIEDAEGEELDSSFGWSDTSDMREAAEQEFSARLPALTEKLKNDTAARIKRQGVLASKLTDAGFDDEDEGPAVLIRLAKGEATGEDFQAAAEYLADYGDDD